MNGPVGHPEPNALIQVPRIPDAPPNSADNTSIHIKELVQYLALTAGIIKRAAIKMTPTA